MGDIRWYKRDPDAALSGMSMLTLEERGAYNTILDLIYSREGNLPDDERTIVRWMGGNVRTWRRIRRRLIELGKLYVHGGMLHNGRSDREIYAVQRKLNVSPMFGPNSKKRPTETTLKFHIPTTRKKEKRTDLEMGLGAVDNAVDKCGQVAEKRSAEQARDEAIRGMRARRKT
jgi:uncharacterized protein YdaU (DUF1376 family)